jgi:4a-hydroxytetrahydrobiopterin dehydratase
MAEVGKPLTRTAASKAVETIGWRYLLGCLCTSIAVTSLAQGVQLAQSIVAVAADDADLHLRIDLREDRVELMVQTRSSGQVTETDADLARRLSAVVSTLGFHPAGATTEDLPRPVQMLEVAIDAMDIPAIRPFWRAVLGYADEPDNDQPDAAIIDPVGQLPAIWFQQMDAPRPQRNRIHLDISVAHDEAEARVKAALDAGGVLVTDEYARMFWVLADVEGNEICVCTWTDRDEHQGLV